MLDMAELIEGHNPTDVLRRVDTPRLLTEVRFVDRERNIAGFGERFAGKPVEGAFSWGKGVQNMAESYAHLHKEDRETVRDRRAKFLTYAGLPSLPHAVLFSATRRYGSPSMIEVTEATLTPPADNGIVLLDNGPVETVLGSDFMYTTEQLTLFVLPADCITSIMYAEGSRGPIVGLLHTGHQQIAEGLPTKAINRLVEAYDVDPKEIIIGISPGLSPENYFFQASDIEKLGKFSEWEEHLTKVSSHPQDNDGNGGYQVDALGRVLAMYQEAGLAMHNITAHDPNNIDTYSSAARGEAFSHRFASVTQNPNGRHIVAAALKS
jgi:copper oxidase (laccase) domain-containing protein